MNAIDHGTRLARLMAQTEPFNRARDSAELSQQVHSFVSAYDRSTDDERAELGLRPWAPDEREIRELLRQIPMAHIRWPILWTAMLAADLQR